MNRYIEEMNKVPFSESFERDTAELLKQAAQNCETRRKGNNMTRKKAVKIIAAAAAAILLLTGTAFAAQRFFAPADVAEALYEDSAAKAFEAADALTIWETKEFGDYYITLDGIAEGKQLVSTFDTAERDRTYAVFSVTRKDGTPFKGVDEIFPFTLTPIVNGFEPWKLSIFNLNAYLLETEIDGIRYILMSTDSIACLADRGISIAVFEGVAPSSEIFAVLPDGTTGFCEKYSGNKALFTLPLDPQKADPKAAQALLDSIEAEARRDDESYIGMGQIEDAENLCTVRMLYADGTKQTETLRLDCPYKDYADDALAISGAEEVYVFEGYVTDFERSAPVYYCSKRG